MTLGGTKTDGAQSHGRSGHGKDWCGDHRAEGSNGERGRAAERGSEGGLPVNGVRVACQ